MWQSYAPVTRGPTAGPEQLEAAFMDDAEMDAVPAAVDEKVRGVRISPAAASALARPMMGVGLLVCGLAGLCLTMRHGMGSGLPESSPGFVDLAAAQDHGADLGWDRQHHIGYFKAKQSGKCLGQPANAGTSGMARAALMECDYSSEASNQRWLVDIASGFIRVLSGNECLDVEGTPGWKSGSSINVAKCSWTKDKDSTDQRWKFDRGGFVVSRLSGKCLSTVENCDGVELRDCKFRADTHLQSWAFVSLAQVATLTGAKAGRTSKALEAEQMRRQIALVGSSGGHELLVYDDVVRGADPFALLGGRFNMEVGKVFKDMSPSWSHWEELTNLGQVLGDAGPEQRALGFMRLTNYVSNLIFAATNFAQGFPLPNVTLEMPSGPVTLRTQDFHDISVSQGCSAYGFAWASFCKWPEPKADESIGIETFQDFIKREYKASMPPHTFFETIFTGKKVPSWEDNFGMKVGFDILGQGLTHLRSHGMEPIKLVRDARDERFAYDVQGLHEFTSQGFSKDFASSKYSEGTDTTSGAAAVERLMEKYKDQKDVLGILMSESVLSMHLSYDRGLKLFVLDLTEFEAFSPLPGYAPLGGRALFEEAQGRLSTVQLHYAGQKFSDFNDPIAEAAFVNSSLRSWRYAEKAIIATAMAKTQLLMHVKTIHLELAPAFQAATVDTMSIGHPMRRLLEPFIGRNVQASMTNLQLWFQFRAGEFGLAPLSMEEQLNVLHKSMEKSPTNLADLDMERYAQARDMQEFTGDKVLSGRWAWKWHQRALRVQRKIATLVDCWVKKYTGGDDGKLLGDEQVVRWWSLLQQTVPALRVATKMSSDFIRQGSTTKAPTTAAPVSFTPPPAPAIAAPAAPTPAPYLLPGYSPPAGQAASAAPAAPPASTSPSGFVPLTALHPNEPGSGNVLDPLNVQTHRRLSIANPDTTTDGLSHISVTRALSTIILWTSWIHEDVGHAMAPLVYDPVYTPMSVPEDGVGVPLVPYTMVTAAYRDFVFLERPKLIDPPPDHWFFHKHCKKLLFFTSCEKPINDKQCFEDFQAGLKELQKSDDAFQACGGDGFHSCMDRVESSAST